MSWRTLAVTLGLGLLAGKSTASIIEYESWYPVSGILRVYDLNNDLFPELTEPVTEAMFPEAKLIEAPAQTAQRHFRRNPPPTSLLMVSESSVETRVHVHVDGAVDGKAVADAIGSGAGLGKTDGKLTFAGATTAAVKKLEVNASTANALVANAAASGSAATNVTGAGHAKTKTPIAAVGWAIWIRASITFPFMIKSMCMMCNIFYQASPMPVISEFKAKGDTGDADLAPYLATAFAGWQWCFYGTFAYLVTQKSGFLVLVYSNVVGAVLGLYFVYAFNSNCKNKAMLQKSTKYYCVLACVAGMQFIAIMTMQTVRALFFSGLVSSAWSTITSCSLLATLPIVYETKNSKSLPFPLLVMGVLSAILWCICGVMLWDPWITFPNTFALVVCNYALYLCYIFPARNDDNCACDVDESYEASSMSGGETPRLDVERASPLQRALGLMRHASESQVLQEANSSVRGYGAAPAGGTGGTGDSF